MMSQTHDGGNTPRQLAAKPSMRGGRVRLTSALVSRRWDDRPDDDSRSNVVWSRCGHTHEDVGSAHGVCGGKGRLPDECS